jgi:RND family efflux transporter MFP subunit
MTPPHSDRCSLYRLGVPTALVSGWVLVLAACGGADSAGADPNAAPGGGPPMAMGVEAVTLTPKPIERITEYVATVKSRRSSTIQPQVEGFITSISARPGQRVARGAVLMQIDASRQQATVASLESQRASRQADLDFARQQAERAKTLFDAGAVSKQEHEQATTAVQTAEAQFRAVEAQIQEQRVELAYHRVTAPMPGIVGDIPVRVGDRVTPATMLTTVDENTGLELYINIPVVQAANLKPGMEVRIVDDRAQPIATTHLNFIAPSVETETQAVLIKAPLQPNAPFRTDQFVRVHLVWSTEPGLTVPLVSVLRINGQYFVYVVEKGDGGTLVARQRPVELGTVIGNDYLVVKGLKPGEQLVVAGVQKIGDGMPVTVTPPGGAAAPTAPAKSEGR